jgi:hypothetical protein
MTLILDPELHVEVVEGHPGRRRLVVTYRLDIPDGDPVVGRDVHEEAVVHACDEHDAPIRPLAVEFRLEGDATIECAGVYPRRLVSEVHRVELDVEQDWWDTDQAGGTEPIAEFADHLAASISVRVDDRTIATADTPTLTGSWGALGSD